jgi:hypothetical protein
VLSPLTEKVLQPPQLLEIVQEYADGRPDWDCDRMNEHGERFIRIGLTTELAYSRRQLLANAAIAASRVGS